MKRIVKVFTSCIIIGSIVFTAMLSSFAYAPNGVELVPVTITNADIINMWNNGDITAYFDFFSPTSADITVFDMLSQSSSIVNVGQSGSNNYIVNINNCYLSNSQGANIVFDTGLSYNLRVNSNASLQQRFHIRLPFEYYMERNVIRFSMATSGTSTTSMDVVLLVHLLEGGSAYNSTYSSTPSIVFWSTTYSAWYTKYNWVPSGYTYDTSSTGIRCKFSSFTFSPLSTSSLVDYISIGASVDSTHTSGTGYDYSFIAPICAYISFAGTYYVDPDIADTVEEYLDLIAGPMSPETEARIEDLKDEFEAQSDALHDAAEDIHKDMPSLPNVSGLPQEVTEGVEEASQYVITPLFGVGIVGTVVGTCLVFAVIKLLLYGSGPS